MTTSETVTRGQAAAPQPRAPRIRTMLVMLFLDLAPALIAYYTLRAFGVTEYLALLAGTVVAGLRMAYVAMKARHFDVFAGFLMTVFAVGLVLSFVTGSVTFLLIKESFGTAVAGLLFLGSCLVRRPLIFYAAKRMRSGDPAEVKRFDELWATEPEFRRIFYVMSLVWGIGLLAESLARIPLVFLLPVDVVAGLSAVMFAGTMVGLSVWNAIYAKRAEARDEKPRNAVME